MKNSSSLALDRKILRRRDLTPAAKLVHGYYFDQAFNPTHGYTQTLGILGEELGLSGRQVGRAISELARAGLIIIGETAIGAHIPQGRSDG